MAHGEFVRAFHMNPMGPVLFFFACVQIPYRMIDYAGLLNGNHWWERVQQGFYPIVWAILGGLVATWMWRMI